MLFQPLARKEDNFEQIEEMDTSRPYDILSVMHYGRNAFAINESEPTMTAKPAALRRGTHGKWLSCIWLLGMTEMATTEQGSSKGTCCNQLKHAAFSTPLIRETTTYKATFRCRM